MFEMSNFYNKQSTFMKFCRVNIQNIFKLFAKLHNQTTLNKKLMPKKPLTFKENLYAKLVCLCRVFSSLD